MRVLADGVFDPLHIGHVRYLRSACMNARHHGGTLIVRVAPDEAIRAKGREPFQTREERGYVLLALSYVDRVVFHDTLADAVYDLKPDRLLKGADWRGKLPDDVLEACQAVGADIKYVEAQERTSTERLSA